MRTQNKIQKSNKDTEIKNTLKMLKKKKVVGSKIFISIVQSFNDFELPGNQDTKGNMGLHSSP